jgi:sucrose-6-phosphate hydrolase SacC (GH32 family)
MGIWKTGGEGPNNAVNRTSRRLLWGTIGWTGGNPLPAEASTASSLHVGSVVALPRDLSLSEEQLSITFASELQSLRRALSHVHESSLSPSTSPAFESRHAEIIVRFPACATVTTPYGLTVLAPNATAGSKASAGYAGVMIGFDPTAGVLTVSGGDKSSTALKLASGEALALHVYVDGSLIEVVANRRASIATVANVPSADANASAVSFFGGACAVGPGGITFDAWQLDSIWQ